MKANHNPVIAHNGDKTRDVIAITAKIGEMVKLSAKDTTDPDGNTVDFKWWIYEDAVTVKDRTTRRFPAGVALTAGKGLDTSIIAPAGEKSATIYVILEARDNGMPNFWAYRRAVIEVKP